MTWLGDVTKNDFLEVGGKGANLGEMVAAGLPVPDGFVVLTSAYKKFVEENGIEEKIQAWMQSVSQEDSKSIEEVSRDIKALFERATIPAAVREALDSNRDFFEQTPVSVRSSATAEDLPGISFAGQYSSFLNVIGDAVYSSIKKCWASLWNGRAISYRIRQGIGHEDIGHAVVVQKLVKSDTSGILFTANPVNGRRDQILINAAPGLGEAIVGGDVTPDQWVVEKDSGSVVEETIARKEVMTLRTADGIETAPVAEDLQTKSTLDPSGIEELHRLAIKVERHFGEPQDIEWASEGGTYYLVQTRPITALFPVPQRREDEAGLRIYVNVNLYSQAMKEPFTPMGEDIVRAMAQGILTDLGRKNSRRDGLWWYKNIGGRIFADITELLRNEKNWGKISNNPNDKDPVTSKALIQVLERNREGICTGKGGLRLVRALNPRLLGFLLKSTGRFLTGIFSARQARQKAVGLGDSILERFKDEKRQLRSTEDKLAFIERNSGTLFLEGFGIVFYVAASSGYISKAQGIVQKHLDAEDLAELKKVEKSVPYSATTDMGMEILRVAESLDSRGKRAEASDQEIQRFLDKYGHRSSIELDVGVPDWKEDPQYVIDLVNSYIDSNSYIEARERFEQGKREAEEAIGVLRDRLLQKGRKRQARKLVKLLTDFREMFGIREQSKFFITAALSIFREVMFEIGDTLVNEGRLRDRADVFFVTREDIRSGQHLEDIVNENKEAFFRELRRPAPRVLTSTGESIYAPSEDEGGDALYGVAVSPGVCEGRVKILVNPEEGHRLEKGDILVTTGTNPSWTPLFLKLGALVMETGGPISHGSVVAREYGVPAVAGVSKATTVLSDGQMVRVNGENGRVEILSDVPEE